jgi:hypothetical protein
MKLSTRTIVPFAAVGLLAGGLGGAAVIDSASASHAGAVSPASAKAHTWKFVAIETGTHSLGKFTFAGTDKDRADGKLVGYDVISGKFHVRARTVDIDFALARRGGLLLGNVVGTEKGVYTGKVTGGTGRYKGAHGTVTGHNAPHNDKKTFLTVTWTK